jgi:hypothetical protein
VQRSYRVLYVKNRVRICGQSSGQFFEPNLAPLHFILAQNVQRQLGFLDDRSVVRLLSNFLFPLLYFASVKLPDQKASGDFLNLQRFLGSVVLADAVKGNSSVFFPALSHYLVHAGLSVSLYPSGVGLKAEKYVRFDPAQTTELSPMPKTSLQHKLQMKLMQQQTIFPPFLDCELPPPLCKPLQCPPLPQCFRIGIPRY